MSRDPAFLFYSQDFFMGTATMSFEDRGKYITILCLMHQQGRMKEETIRFLLGSISDNLKAKFLIDENGLWYNTRLEEEAEKRKNFTESRYNNGLKGGRPRKYEKNDDVKQETYKKPSGKPTHNLIENEDEDENKDEVNKEINEQKIEKPKKSKNIKFVPPELLDVETYFLENGFTKELAAKFFNGYNSANWSDQRGNKINNWKLKAQHVWFVNNDKFRITEGVQKLGKKSVLQSAQETVNGALKLIQEQYGTDANI